ncbi:phage protein Gp13 family protein [Phascolarctobacterium sp.]
MAKKYKVELADVDNAVGIAVALLKDLRDSDRLELEAYEEDAVMLITGSIENADHCYIYRDMEDNILGIVGLSSIASVPGKEVWMLATKKVSGYKKELLILAARALISKWVKEYGRLYNYVYSGNSASIRWLDRLGAMFLAPVKIKKNGKDFLPFVIEEGSI